MQHSSVILLVRPVNFGYNAETAVNNAFQAPGEASPKATSEKAVSEFETLRGALEREGVRVLVFDDTADPVKPDAIFPNNWVSFHPDGTVILYPMFAPNRRYERRMDIVRQISEQFQVNRVIDLGHYEAGERFLEGTGSIVFDHVNRQAFACLSPRTDEGILDEVCGYLGYKTVVFHATDHGGMPIYHTNVMMCIGDRFSVVCKESIRDEKERGRVISSLEKSGRSVVGITLSQVNHFAGNMLPVKGEKHDLLVMSQSAFEALDADQKDTLSGFCRLLPVPVTTIESIGGGSTRCMMAEVFLPLKDIR